MKVIFDFSKEEEVSEGVSQVASLESYMMEQVEMVAEAPGESRVIAIGESRGVLLSAKKLYDRGYSYEDIEDLLGVTEDELLVYIEQKEER